MIDSLLYILYDRPRDGQYCSQFIEIMFTTFLLSLCRPWVIRVYGA